MFRIDSNAANTAAVLPAPLAAGTPGYFQDTANPGTVVSADWANMIQEELANAVVGGGQVLSKTTFNQLYLAIVAIAQANAGAPGDVKMTAATVAPAGWLLCRGQAVSRVTYAALFAAIGTECGAGDGVTTFNLPNMQGQFPRGYDAAGTVDAGRALGSTQADTIKAHDHLNGYAASSGTDNPMIYATTNTDVPGFSSKRSAPSNTPPDIQGHTSSTGGTETRPKNVALNFIIKV